MSTPKFRIDSTSHARKFFRSGTSMVSALLSTLNKDTLSETALSRIEAAGKALTEALTLRYSESPEDRIAIYEGVRDSLIEVAKAYTKAREAVTDSYNRRVLADVRGVVLTLKEAATGTVNTVRDPNYEAKRAAAKAARQAANPKSYGGAYKFPAKVVTSKKKASA